MYNYLGVHSQLFRYENIENEPFEKASDPINIDIPINLIYFSRMKAQALI